MDKDDIQWLREAATRLFMHNRVSRVGPSGKVDVYHAPSLGRFPGRYPHQWFWDSCAHAVALRHIDPASARQEISSLLAAQHENGFIPHQIFNRARMNLLDRIAAHIHPSINHSPYLQPPVIAQAVFAIWQSTGDMPFVHSVLPGLKQYHRFLRATRKRNEDDLLEIIHSYESGKDRSREYDSVYGWRQGTGLRALPAAVLILRYRLLGWDLDRIFESNLFRVKDLLFNCLCARDLSDLAELCRIAGEPGESHNFSLMSAGMEAGILAKMYDPPSGVFYSLDSRHGADRKLEVSTFSTFLPLLLETIPEATVDRLVEQHLAREDEYWTAYPVPSEPLGSPEAEWRKTGLWRGLQVWVIINWFITRGLLRQAARFPAHRERYRSLAIDVTARTCAMVKSQGFREYYHARTGKGDRARDFGMSALALDMAYLVSSLE